jgi:hypothetical protein
MVLLSSITESAWRGQRPESSIRFEELDAGESAAAPRSDLILIESLAARRTSHHVGAEAP